MVMNRSAEKNPVISVAASQLARVAGEGSARHPHLAALLEGTGPHTARDLSDAVHLLCSLHGRYPGLIELALQRCPKGSTNNRPPTAIPKVILGPCMVDAAIV